MLCLLPSKKPHSWVAGVLDYLSMVNPMEQEMRRVNDVMEREKAAEAHNKFENLADDAPKVPTPETHGKACNANLHAGEIHVRQQGGTCSERGYL